ncbi:MAG: hypothetical protein JO161_03365, partial [Planctomycetaceae bacterium]|nr:hypothetical protein [Planctomycetaceae bacterium]
MPRSARFFPGRAGNLGSTGKKGRFEGFDLMRRVGRTIWTERALLALVLASLAGTLDLVIAVHRSTLTHRQPVVAHPEVSASTELPPKPVPELVKAPSVAPTVVQTPPVSRTPEPPPKPPEDPTKLAVDKLAAATAQEVMAAREADRRAESLEEARLNAIAQSERWRRRETLVKQQIASLTEQTRKIDEQIDLLAADRDVLARERDALKAAVARAQQGKGSYAVLPYKGPNGSWRRPIVLDCSDGTVTLRPKGPTFSMLDLSAMIHVRSSPVVIAIARELLRVQASESPDGAPVVPYFVFLVRPDGIRPYYEIRARLESLGIAFGYELIPQDLKVDVPDFDNLATWDGTIPLEESLTSAPGPGTGQGGTTESNASSGDGLSWPSAAKGSGGAAGNPSAGGLGPAESGPGGAGGTTSGGPGSAGNLAVGGPGGAGGTTGGRTGSENLAGGGSGGAENPAGSGSGAHGSGSDSGSVDEFVWPARPPAQGSGEHGKSAVAGTGPGSDGLAQAPGTGSFAGGLPGASRSGGGAGSGSTGSGSGRGRQNSAASLGGSDAFGFGSGPADAPGLPSSAPAGHLLPGGEGIVSPSPWREKVAEGRMRGQPLAPSGSGRSGSNAFGSGAASGAGPGSGEGPAGASASEAGRAGQPGSLLPDLEPAGDRTNVASNGGAGSLFGENFPSQGSGGSTPSSTRGNARTPQRTPSSSIGGTASGGQDAQGGSSNAASGGLAGDSLGASIPGGGSGSFSSTGLASSDHASELSWPSGATSGSPGSAGSGTGSTSAGSLSASGGSPSMFSPSSSTSGLVFDADASPATTKAKERVAAPRFKSRIPDGPSKTIEVPFEIVVVCGPDGLVIHPGGYQVSSHALGNGKKEGIVVRELLAVANQRAAADPTIRPQPRVKFLIETGGT